MNPDPEVPGSPPSVFVGTAGWSYPDWKGIVTPSPAPAAFDDLRFTAKLFAVIEINNTFYRPPQLAPASAWAKRVAGIDGFRFTVKLHKTFTHHAPSWTDQDAAAFLSGLAPLRDAGLLGALLAQFPFYFRNDEDGRRRIARIARAFRGVPLAVELRDPSWEHPAVYRFFESLHVGLCHVDSPASTGPHPARPARVGPVGYLRLHGRNREAWFRKGAGRDAKYDYLYRPEELAPWRKVLLEAASEGRPVFAVANNHFKGKAPVAALLLQRIVSGEGRSPPPSLLREYPLLGQWLDLPGSPG